MSAILAPTHFNSYNAYLKQRFGKRAVKVSLDLGVFCPHRKNHPPGCIYCRPGVIMNDELSHKKSITEQIEVRLDKLARRYKTDVFLAYFQNETPTAGDIDWLLANYREAFDHPKVAGVIVSTRPDSVPEHLFELLAEKSKEKPVFIEFGLQSIHDQTLEKINRGHDFAVFKNALKKAQAANLPVGVHLILGLPGETPEMMMQTFAKMGDLGVDSIKIHHLQIYKNSFLEQEFKEDKVETFKTFDDYLPVLLDCLEVLPWEVKVQRLVADSPREYVIAPAWMENKNTIIQRVEQAFEARGTRQGFLSGRHS